MMDTNTLTLKAHSTNKPQIAIRFGTEWVKIRVKFPRAQTVSVAYPARSLPYVIGYPHHCITEHISEAANYWFNQVAMAVSAMPVPEKERKALEYKRVMYFRCKLLQERVADWLDKEAARSASLP